MGPSVTPAREAPQGPSPGECRCAWVIPVDGWVGHRCLVDLACDKHLRIERRDNISASKLNRIDGIEIFWSLATRRLSALGPSF